MPNRTWAPGSPEYFYHVYDDPIVPAAFTKGFKTNIARRGGSGVESSWVFSLKKDMDALRTYGRGLGIVDSISTLGTVPPDNNDLMVLKVGTGAHKVLFAGCHHAREWISVEIPYLVAEYLIYNYTANPTTPKQKRIKHLLMNRQITFVPMVNPNGHQHTFSQDRNWRPNRIAYSAPSAALPSTVPPAPALSAPQFSGGPPRSIRYPNGISFRGVDINRNYPTPNWGQETPDSSGTPGGGTSRNPTDSGANSTWCGPSANSEPETRLMVNLGNFDSVITYHNYGEVIFYPDAAVGNTFVEWVGRGMRDLIAQPPGHRYDFMNNSNTVIRPDNYLTTGELIDHAYNNRSGRPAFTPELRPLNNSAGWAFSGLPRTEIEPCFLENLPAALALINCAGHNAVAAAQSTNVATGSPPTKCQMVRHCWEVFRGWTP